MDILLYNPLSRNGQNPKFIQKIARKLSKKGDVRVQNVLDINNPDDFIKSLADEDRVIIVGGDGTLNRIANRIYGQSFNQEIYMYRAGTGNDFMRSVKTKNHMVPLKAYIEHLPHVIYNGKKTHFINGTGIGLDGYVGHLVNTSHHKKNKLNYFRQAIKAFGVFEPMEATIQIDDVVINEKKVWLTSVMHGAFYGGGMKIAPKAKRQKDVFHVVLVKDVPKWLLIFIFPTIYLGWHTIFKSFVKIYPAKYAKMTFTKDTHMQIDGEHDFPIQVIECHV
jgi:diacylglycerol kinase (ATP)